MIVLTDNHQGSHSIRVNGSILISKDDFRMSSDTWSYLTACLYKFPYKNTYGNRCECCGDSDVETTIDIPLEHLINLINVHKILDNCLATKYNHLSF
jgi:hypothetical protein